MVIATQTKLISNYTHSKRVLGWEKEWGGEGLEGEINPVEFTNGHMLAHFVLNCGLLVLVEVNLDEAASVQLDTDTLAHDLSREAQILQDVVVYHRQSAAVHRNTNETKPQ